MLEYILVAGMLIATIGIMTVFLFTFRENSSRSLKLVASEYP